MSEEKKLPITYTKQELATILQLTTTSINNYIAKGLIKPMTMDGAVRFSEAEVNRILGVE
jgi:predicted site-specific integrase-resolvase